jgi:hypothetical protein
MPDTPGAQFVTVGRAMAEHQICLKITVEISYNSLFLQRFYAKKPHKSSVLVRFIVFLFHALEKLV